VALRDGHGIALALDMSTDTRAGSFLVGAALAVAWTQRAPWLRTLRRCGQRITVVGCLLVLGWGSWVFDHGVSRSVLTLTWAAVSVAAGLIVVAFLGDGQERRSGIVSSPVVRYIGRRSYGLYLWHYVWLTWLGAMGLLGVPLALAASFASAEVSWRLVERPALARKHSFTSTPARNPSPPPVVTPPVSLPLPVTVRG